MTFSRKQAQLTNWSKSEYSPCTLYQASSVAEIAKALAAARAECRTVIPHGAGHSYTDAALNTGGMVIDVTSMRRILSWNAERGIMCVEPGVTLRDMVQLAWRDGWWPYVSPSTPQVTIGGCTAMNVNGRNAWKCGPFGAHVLALDVIALTPEEDVQLFHAFVGSLGLLGILISITVQLERITSGFVTVRKRSASSLAGIFTIFGEEGRQSDFIEAWLDGSVRGQQLGRGTVTSASMDRPENAARSSFPMALVNDRLKIPFIKLAADLGRRVLIPGVQAANCLNYHWENTMAGRRRALYPYTYWPSAVLAGYDAMFPEGVETFQTFIPTQQANEIFEHLLRYSQRQGCIPVWCILKQHRRDPFLLSYQVDGFSLELNYPRTRQTALKLKQVLQDMNAATLEAGGKFYLAKDHFLTNAQYCQSVGDEVVDAFLHLKKHYDPETLLQSDLFRRIFQPSNQ